MAQTQREFTNKGLNNAWCWEKLMSNQFYIIPLKITLQWSTESWGREQKRGEDRNVWSAKEKNPLSKEHGDQKSSELSTLGLNSENSRDIKAPTSLLEWKTDWSWLHLKPSTEGMKTKKLHNRWGSHMSDLSSPEQCLPSQPQPLQLLHRHTSGWKCCLSHLSISLLGMIQICPGHGTLDAEPTTSSHSAPTLWESKSPR